MQAGGDHGRGWHQGSWYLLSLALAGALAMIARGLVRSDILTSQPWNPVMAKQVGLVGVAMLGALIVAIAAERRWLVRLETGLAAAGMIVIVAAFGIAPVAVVGIFLLSTIALGTSFSVRLPGANNPPLVFVAVFGAAVYTIVFTLMAPLPINTLTLHSLLLVAPPVFAWANPRTRMALLKRLHALPDALRPPANRTAAETAGLATFLFIAMLHALLCALPERYWDPMVNHLYVPSYIAAHGMWSYDATSYVGAFMPAAVDFIYAHFFLLGGERATQLYNFFALILLCAAFRAILLRVATREAAIWTTVLFASMPIAFIETSSLFVENTLALWITGAVGLIVATELRPDPRHAVMILALLAAASISKLHGAVAAAIIGPVMLVLFFRQRPKCDASVCVLVACVVFGAAACFPYVYSWANTGNPLLPFYNDVFKSPFFATIRFSDARWVGHLSWSLVYDVTFASGHFLEAGPGALGLTIVLLVPLAVAALLGRPQAKPAFCFALGLAIALPIGLQIQYLRYFFPVFPLLLIPAAVGLDVLFERRLSYALTFGLVAVAAFNIYKLPSGGWILGDFDLRAAFDPVARRQLELRQAPERIANRFLNEVAGTETRVLYTGNPYGALLQGHALYNNWYNPRLAAEMRDLSTAEEAKALLVRWSVTHVVLTKDGRDAGQRVMGEYLSTLPPIAALGPLTVYDVLTPP